MSKGVRFVFKCGRYILDVFQDRTWNLNRVYVVYLQSKMCTIYCLRSYSDDLYTSLTEIKVFNYILKTII